MKELKIITAFDHCITRFGLKILCKEAFPNVSITEVDSVGELYRETGNLQPDLVILNYHFKNNSCLSIIPDLAGINKDINIFVVSPGSEMGLSNRLINAGARGYINGNFDNITLINALRSVVEGRIYISQDEYMYQLQWRPNERELNNPFDALSNKEMEIVEYLKMGYNTSTISEKSRLAMSTVSTYKNRIFNKLHVDNVVSLLELARIYRTT